MTEQTMEPQAGGTATGLFLYGIVPADGFASTSNPTRQ